MSKKNIIISVAVLLVIIILGFLHYKSINTNQYNVVYMTTGEVYVGKLKTFPNFELSDGYILQTTKDATDPAKTNFQLNPINQAIWATPTMHLIEKNIVFYGPLLPTSKIVETIAGQENKI